jgi:hypothetical protein
MRAYADETCKPAALGAKLVRFRRDLDAHRFRFHRLLGIGDIDLMTSEI